MFLKTYIIKVSGALFLYVNSLSIEKRFQACEPIWIPTGPCLGDCHTATQPYTTTNCTPQFSLTDCHTLMPCTCSIFDFPLNPGVVTCGDCSNITSGASCYVGCSFGTLNGPNHILCLDNGWVDVTITCPTLIPTCPNIYPIGGLNVDMSSHCFGALEGQVCNYNCLPEYYNESGIYTATCSNSNGILNWSITPQCICQDDCNYFSSCHYSKPFNQYL